MLLPRGVRADRSRAVLILLWTVVCLAISVHFEGILMQSELSESPVHIDMWLAS